MGVPACYPSTLAEKEGTILSPGLRCSYIENSRRLWLWCCGNFGGLGTLTPIRAEEKSSHHGTEARTTAERLQSQAHFVFSFYSLQSQGDMAKQSRIYRTICGSQQVAKGKDPLFQLFL